MCYWWLWLASMPKWSTDFLLSLFSCLVLAFYRAILVSWLYFSRLVFLQLLLVSWSEISVNLDLLRRVHLWYDFYLFLGVCFRQWAAALQRKLPRQDSLVVLLKAKTFQLLFNVHTPCGKSIADLVLVRACSQNQELPGKLMRNIAGVARVLKW